MQKDILKLRDQLYELWGDFDELLRQIYYAPELVDDDTLFEVQSIFYSLMDILMDIKHINDESSKEQT